MTLGKEIFYRQPTFAESRALGKGCFAEDKDCQALGKAAVSGSARLVRSSSSVLCVLDETICHVLNNFSDVDVSIYDVLISFSLTWMNRSGTC